MEIVYLIIGLLVGAFFIFLFINGKLKTAATQLALLAQQLEQEQSRKQQLEQKLAQVEEDKDLLNRELTQEKIEHQRVATQLLAEQERYSKESELRKDQFEQQLKTVQEQFANLANTILERTSERLKSTNTESMEHLKEPLKITLDKLHDAIQQTNNESVRNTASLSQQLKQMTEQTQKIESTATRLTNVIRGGNKAQGNWGERMLTEILDSQGFQVGVDYDVQQTITDEKGFAVVNDESGKRMIPDVILHYPNNEDVVIDAKMSIDAYYQYVNTEEVALKKKFASDLVNSIRTQATKLAKKDYSNYIQAPRKAIDFVIMFVPNEGALQLALATDPKIWSEAFDKQVFITSQQNLMAILKMIQIAWRQYAQTENQKKVYGLAEELLKRVGEFIKRFDKVGKDITALHKDYDDAYNKAYTGRQSIVQKASELKDLGVKESANQPIPLAEPELDLTTNEPESEK